MGNVANVAAVVAPLLSAAGKKSPLDLLEKAGIISKTVEGGNFFKDVSKGVSKAAKSTGKAVVSGAKYVKKHENDIRKVAKNSLVKDLALQ